MGINEQCVFPPAPSGGAKEWSDIEEKPFDEIGDGLSVDEEGRLNIDLDMKTFVFKGYVSANEPTGKKQGNCGIRRPLCRPCFPYRSRSMMVGNGVQIL